MAIDLLVGLQWGDEGKGKNIDQLLSTGNYSGVARFQGGANAGHTLMSNGITFVGHIIPSGCLQNDVELYVGNGVVVDIVSLVKEIGELKELGFDVKPRLYVSNRAKLVSYLHPFLDQAEECFRSKSGEKIGTTSRGIGPAYSDSRARRGLLVGDIMLPDFNEKEKDLADFHMNLLQMYKDKYNFEIDFTKINEAKEKWWNAIKEVKQLNICDVSHLIQKRLSEGKHILAEGAQGIMLDIDFGDYPNVTSSNVLPANVCLGLGVPHSAIRDVYGVMKTYTTKVGGGDFPSRIENKETEGLFQKAGGEFGATTGRPRMCGWLDLFALRYAIKLGGINKIFINKADVCPTDSIEVAYAYEVDGKVTEEFPLRLHQVTGVKTEKMPGWGNANDGVSDIKKISPELINYINYLKNKLNDLNVQIVSIGTGPDRAHHIDLL